MASTQAIDTFTASCPEVRRFWQIGRIFSTRTHTVRTHQSVKEDTVSNLLLEEERLRLRQEQKALAMTNAKACRERFPHAFNIKTIEVDPEFFSHFIGKSWSSQNHKLDFDTEMAIHRMVKKEGLQKYDLLVLMTPSDTRRQYIFIDERGLSGRMSDHPRKWSQPTYEFWLRHGTTPDIFYQSLA